ncbi:MAG: alpha/beta hydrolase family esterase [Ktedonobacterales bacterium]
MHGREGARLRSAALVAALLICGALLAGGGDHAFVHAAPARALSTPPPVAWPDDGAIDHPVASTGCARPAPVAPGVSAEQSVAIAPAAANGASTRSYRVHVPTGYAATRQTPVVLVFHGGGGRDTATEAATGFSALADQQGFLAVYPQGLAFAALGAGYTTWAATGPLDSIANGVDERLYISNLLDALQAHFCVAARRIYATGFSAGGAMTAFLTCTLAGRFAAFAPLSGDAYTFPGGCHPSRSTSILEFHGSADPYELYTGIPAREDPDYRRIGVLEWLTIWAQRDGCTSGPAVFVQVARVVGEQWSGCRDGTAVAHYRLIGWGHALPPAIDGVSADGVIWRFFQAHPLVSAT